MMLEEACKQLYLSNGVWSQDDRKQSWDHLAKATHVPHITQRELQAGKAGQEIPARVLASNIWSAVCVTKANEQAVSCKQAACVLCSQLQELPLSMVSV